jgi:hypothetical protein
MSQPSPRVLLGERYGWDDPAPGTRLWRYRNHPDTLSSADWRQLVADFDARLATVRCVYCESPVVYRADDPVIHVGCAIASDADTASAPDASPSRVR